MPKTLIAVLLSVMSSCFSFAEADPGAATGIEGVISISPIHGGPTRVGVSDSKPLANVEFIAQSEKGIATSFTTDEQGRFRVLLTPGRYTVSKKEKSGRIGSYGPFEVDVADGKMTKVQWNCDSGMR
jgi:hypothetical protein